MGTFIIIDIFRVEDTRHALLMTFKKILYDPLKYNLPSEGIRSRKIQLDFSSYSCYSSTSTIQTKSATSHESHSRKSRNGSTNYASVTYTLRTPPELQMFQNHNTCSRSRSNYLYRMGGFTDH